MAHGRWQFWIDRGGTFTDVVARRPDRRLVTGKLLSQQPSRYADAAVAGIRMLMGVAPDAPLPVDEIDSVRMGTTVATNALLERAGEDTVLVVTAGFGDALRIGYQNRPRIFDRQITLPSMLYRRVIEVDERITADGVVLRSPDLSARGELANALRRAHADGIRAVAVVFLHSHRYPEHELAVGDLAMGIGFDQVSCSAEVSRLMKLVPRGDTAVVDAYLSPVLRRYVRSVAGQLDGVPLKFMQSNGGLAQAGRFRGKDAILSGPAGGIVGAVRATELAGFTHMIGFDMGGTSTDVSHHAGEFERVFDTQVAGVRLRAPMLDIHTVAAGGGSVLQFDGARYRVGPQSAGAWPGPACYGNDGPLAVTDANVALGRIQPEHFPMVFGPTGDQPLDAAVVRRRFAELARVVRDATGDSRTPEQVAQGFLDIAVANMARAVKQISVQKGRDVSGYALTSFGGAGGQHACAVADALGITNVLVPPMAGVLSALGIGLADTTAIREQSIEVPLDVAAVPVLAEVAARLQDEATARLDLPTSGNGAGTGIGSGAGRPLRVVRQVLLRYAGTDTPIAVAIGSTVETPVDVTLVPRLTGEFVAKHRQLYSFTMDRPIIVEAMSVEVSQSTDPAGAEPAVPPGASGAVLPEATVAMYTGGRWVQVPLYLRSRLTAGQSLIGPAIVAEDDATTVVDPGWSAGVTGHGHLHLRRVAKLEPVTEPVTQPVLVGGSEPDQPAATAVDPVRLEIFNNLFMSIAEQMGLRLAATAQSVNIRERLDFSCALFDAEGNLIANAPHIPVHLGSMGASVTAVIDGYGDRLRPGDVVAVNDPYRGGTHLPDVTVITPVFAGDGRTLRFFVASRGHHAEIGGITPGSMPAASRTLDEEGVLFTNWLLVSGGRLREAETLALLRDAVHPSRNPAANLADLRAQIAANAKGVDEVKAMIDHFGWEVVRAYMGHVQDNAAEAVRRVLPTLRNAMVEYEMDCGAIIRVSISVDPDGRNATIDFSGSSAQLDSNLNAPSAVVTAAVLYVFRTLVDEDIPLNAGCLRPLRIVVEDGSMLCPRSPAAVVAGNVETSQAITGALYAALGVQAEGSGTMNNISFGNDRYQYYETVASGSGAGDGFPGTSVVQTHMTNSRLTDPEVLESRFPVRLEEFAIRPGSGGRGRYPGGDGAIRRIRFDEPMTVSTLAGHRRVPPYGLAGGEPGALGATWVERVDGSVVRLAGCETVEVESGDVLVVQTPGGGGYGPPGSAR